MISTCQTRYGKEAILAVRCLTIYTPGVTAQVGSTTSAADDNVTKAAREALSKLAFSGCALANLSVQVEADKDHKLCSSERLQNRILALATAEQKKYLSCLNVSLVWSDPRGRFTKLLVER